MAAPWMGAPWTVALGWLLLAFSLCKTPLGETGWLGIPYSLFYWLPKHPVLWFTTNSPPAQSVTLPMVTYSHCAAPL